MTDKMDANMVQPKLQQLFEKLLDPEFEIKTDTYLSRLVTHLSDQEKPVDATPADNPFFSDSLIKAVTTWETENRAPSSKIASFTLTLTSLVARNENRFNHLNGLNVFLRLVHVVRARQSEVAPSVKLGYIKLLAAFLEHRSGIQWIMTCDLWSDVLKFTLTNQTVYITKEGYRFLSKILEQTIDHSESFCQNVVKQVMAPLSDGTYKTIKATGEMMEISDEIVYQNLSPTLNLIVEILQYFLESVLFAQNDTRIVSIFLRDFHLEQQICNFLMIAQNANLVFELSKLMLITQFLEMYIMVLSNDLNVAAFKLCVRKLMSVFTTNVTRGLYENVLKLCFSGQYYWNLMGYKIPCRKVNKDNVPLTFANQLLVIQLLPIFAVGMKYCGDTCQYSDEFRDQYVQKLFMLMCENTVRIAYSWRDFLTVQPNIFNIATRGLIYVMKSRKYYPRERAAMAFQSFIYNLKDVICVIKSSPEKMPYFSQQVNYLSLLFEAIVVFIEEFQITWRDSVETICVMNVSFDFLSIPTWPTQMVVKALKLVNVSLVKYMSPNLALLVDRTNDSTLAVLGPLLHTKLHDMTWEVRDSALEVVCTISRMSSTKLGSFNLCTSILTNWIKVAVAEWSTARSNLRTDVASFTLSIGALLARDETSFLDLGSNNFFIKLVNISKAGFKETDVVVLSYIELLGSFLEHQSRVEWMMASSFWEDVHGFALTRKEENILRKSVSFIGKILEKTSVLDEGFCVSVVKKLMLPLGDNIYKALKHSTEAAFEVLQPTLQLIGRVLEHFLDGFYFEQNDFHIVLMFFNNFHSEERISDFLMMAQSQCLRFDVLRILFVMQFAELYVKMITNTITPSKINTSLVRMKQSFEINLAKSPFDDLINYCGFGLLFWRLVESKICKDYSITTELILLHVIPHYVILLKYCYEKHELEGIQQDEIRESYFQKIFSVMSHDGIRLCYGVRNSFVEEHLDPVKYSIICSNQLKAGAKYFSKDEAILFAQIWIFFIGDFVVSIKEAPNKLEFFEDKTRNVCDIMDHLTTLIEDFDITWKENFHSIDALANFSDFLMLHSWPKDVIVKNLKLISVAISKYMALNLALLLDDGKDASITFMGPLLYTKLLDDDDDIKCASLDVVTNIAHISYTKVETFLVSAPILVDWLKNGVVKWSTTKITLCTDVVCFILELTSLLSRNENRFCALNSHNFFIKLVNALKVRDKEREPKIKIGYIELLSSFLEHQSGIEWMTGCNFWEDIHNFGLQSQNEDVIEKSVALLSKMLEKCLKEDLSFCDGVVKKIMQPLGDNAYKLEASPTLKLVAAILEHFLDVKRNFHVVLLFLRNFQRENRISDLMVFAQNKKFVLELSKIMYIMQIAEIYIEFKKNGSALVKDALAELKQSFMLNVVSTVVFETFTELCAFAIVFWNFVETKIESREKNAVAFSTQFLFFLPLPEFILIWKKYYTESEYILLWEEESREHDCLAALKMMSQETIRCCYYWRDRIFDSEQIVEYSLFANQKIKKLTHHLFRDQAALLVQEFTYCFIDFISAIKKSPRKIENVSDYTHMKDVVEILVTCIESFQITWKDSFICVELISAVLSFFVIHSWSKDMVSKNLKLLSVAISKSMAPDLALLIESDSTTTFLGPIIYSKLKDEDVEVKKNAIQVVKVIAKSKSLISDKWYILNCMLSKMDRERVQSFTEKLKILLDFLVLDKSCEDGLTKFLAELKQQEIEEVETFSISVPILVGWLKQSVVEWSSTGVILRTDVVCFILGVTSLLSHNENRFCALNSNNFFIKMVNVLKLRERERETKIKLGYIELLSSFLEHQSGIEWITGCNFWEDIHNFGLHSQNEEVVENSIAFLAKMLENCFMKDLGFCDDVVKKIMQPLDDHIYKSFKAIETTCQLRTTLEFVAAILEYFLDVKHNFNVALLFLRNFQQEKRISDLTVFAQDNNLVLEASKILYVMQITELFLEITKNPSIRVEDTLKIMKDNFIHNVVSVDCFETYINFCEFAVLFWNFVESRIEKPQENVCFSTQFLVLQMMAPFAVIFTKYYDVSEIAILMEDEARDHDIMVSMKMMSHAIVRCYYYWRKQICHHENLLEFALFASTKIKKCMKHLFREQAAHLVQKYTYVFTDFVKIVQNFPSRIQIFHPSHINDVFDILTSCIEDFEITWKDVIKSTELLSGVLSFFVIYNWPKDLVLRNLKLMKVAISKNMAPDLALLVENDSTTDTLVFVLFSKLRDEDEEVKMASLEIVNIIAKSSK